MSSRKETQKWSGNTTPTKEKKVRSWCLTFWECKPVYDEKQMSYLIIGAELCPGTQKLHYQCWVYFYNGKTFSQVKKYFKEPGIHIEKARGTPTQNIAYCSKDGEYEEFGTPPMQGKRTDLDDIRNDISNNVITVDQITIDNPVVFHQYGRTLNRIEDIYARNKFRTEMTKGIWICGPTGCGKSHIAFRNYNPRNHYLLINDGGWWDGYTGHDTVIINDFRGWIPYDTLLQLIDKWPMSVKRRGREPIPFTSKNIIITSSLTPQEVYCNRAENDDIAQLLRRLEVFEMGDNADENEIITSTLHICVDENEVIQ